MMEKYYFSHFGLNTSKGNSGSPYFIYCGPMMNNYFCMSIHCGEISNNSSSQLIRQYSLKFTDEIMDDILKFHQKLHNKAETIGVIDYKQMMVNKEQLIQFIQPFLKPDTCRESIDEMGEERADLYF